MIYLFSSTQLREIVKLPVLFQHFIEHKQVSADLSFLEYLSDHYNSAPHTDNDEERDNQLPFKIIEVNSLSASAVPISICSILYKLPAEIIKENTFKYREGFVPSPNCGKIWQPPKGLLHT